MMKLIQIVILALIFTSCNRKSEFIGNWGYCESHVYNELYINDSTFYFYFNDFGFIPPLKYKISNDSIYLYNLNGQLEHFGIYKFEKEGNLHLDIKNKQSKKESSIRLFKFFEEVPKNNSSNVDDYYIWLNNEFLPEFEKRVSRFDCPRCRTIISCGIKNR